MKDFYYILGTDSRCTPAELNEAYRKLSQKLAPALGEDDFFLQSHFNEISEAYQILSDPIKRKRYDEAVTRIHRKQLANFRTKNLGVATVGALILFTALFGFYVLRSLNNNGKVAPTATVAEAPAIAAAPVKAKHRKKKHRSNSIVKSTSIASIKTDSVKQVAAVKPPSIVAAPVNKNIATQAKTSPVAKATSAITPPSNIPLIKSEMVVTAPVNKAAAPVVARTYAPADSSYVTYLKPMSEQIYLHQQADYMSSVVTVLPNHPRVKVLAKGTTFYKIAYNNQVGYVPRWAVVKP